MNNSSDVVRSYIVLLSKLKKQSCTFANTCQQLAVTVKICCL